MRFSSLLPRITRSTIRYITRDQTIEPKRVINFSAGPAMLPREVLLEARADLYSYKGCGMSVMEMSHVSEEYTEILNETHADLREVMQVPDNYKVLFLSAGATGQFAGVPLNLCKNVETATDYLITGSWSVKAFQEAKMYCKPSIVNSPTDKYIGVTPQSEWKLNPNAEYLHYCSNETIHGVELLRVPESHGIDLVCDMSSNICSRPVDVSKFAIIYAGAHKNLGPAGVTIVIVREDLLEKASPYCPSVLKYKVQADAFSIYNTPPTYNIYMCGLVLKWIKNLGGLKEIEKRNIEKSSLVYKTIDESNGFYMSVGGLRASLYNAVTLEEVHVLVEFMKDFQLSCQ